MSMKFFAKNMLALCVLACSSLLPLFSFPFPAVSHTFVSKSQSLLLFPPSLCTLCSQMVLALFPLNHFHSNCPVACLHFSTPPFQNFWHQTPVLLLGGWWICSLLFFFLSIFSLCVFLTFLLSLSHFSATLISCSRIILAVSVFRD